MNGQIEQALRRTFADPGIAAETFGALSRDASAVAQPSGTRLLSGTARNDTMLLTRGTVVLFACDKQTGHRVGMALFGPGTVLAAPDIADDISELSVVALGNVEMVRAPSKSVDSAALNDARFAAALREKEAERLEAILRFASDTAFLSSEARLAARLVDLATFRARYERIHVHLGKLVQGDLADLVGVTRRRVSTILTTWFRSGVVFQDAHQHLYLLDVATLAEAARAPTGRTQCPSWLFSIDRLLDAGITGEAGQLALEAYERDPKVLLYLHRAALALARSGDRHGAEELLERSSKADTFDECLSLKGRLAKDAADDAPEEERQALYRRAAEHYAAAYDVTPSAYAALNASACFRLEGNAELSMSWAERTLETMGGGTDYWTEACRAEALLLKGDPRAAEAFLELRAHPGAKPALITSTRKQLIRLGTVLKSAEVIAAERFPKPKEAFFAGAIFEPDAACEEKIAQWTDEILTQEAVDGVVGALAAGSDIVMAEAAVRRGCTFTAILPTSPDRFIKSSIAPFGKSWVERARLMLERAVHVHVVAPLELGAELTDYGFLGQVSQGQAVWRAADLEADLVGLFAKREDAAAPSITGAMIACWEQRVRREAHVLTLEAISGRGASGDASQAEFYLFKPSADDQQPTMLGKFGSCREALEAARDAAKTSASLLLDAGPSEEAGLLASLRPELPDGKVMASPTFAALSWLENVAARELYRSAGVVPSKARTAPCALFEVAGSRS